MRRQCNNDRKTLVGGLVKTGQAHTSEEKSPRPRRRYEQKDTKASNPTGIETSKETGLVALKETAEPEEEEDTLEDIRQQDILQRSNDQSF